MAQLADLGIEPFDLVVSNLYPFTETVQSGASPEECVEQIDIGGPSMVRAAAKNHASVAIVTDPAEYPTVLMAVRGGGFTLEQRRRPGRPGVRAHRDVRRGGRLVDGQRASPTAPTAPASRPGPARPGTRRRCCATARTRTSARRSTPTGAAGLANAEQLHGKEMSYNNYVDADAAQRAASRLRRAGRRDHQARQPVRHRGRRRHRDGAPARRTPATRCPPTAASIATNRPVTAELAAQVAEIFTEVVVAPDFEPEALEILTRKKNIRLLRLPAGMERTADQVEFRAISGGVLMQTRDKIDAEVDGGRRRPVHAGRWRPATPRTRPPWPTWRFAWRAIRAVKSNAILLADRRREASASAWARSTGSTPAGSRSPAPGSARAWRGRGLRRVLPVRRRPAGAARRRGPRRRRSPGGSVRDAEVVAAATAAGVTMYFTGTRHFAH